MKIRGVAAVLALLLLLTARVPAATPVFPVDELRAGMVGVNGGNFTFGDMPFGGLGHSGHGREWGAAGIVEFTTIKTVAAAYAT